MKSNIPSSPKPNSAPRYEDYTDIIDAEIAKRKYKWNLTSLTFMDFDDVAQIIRFHIYQKWSQYQATRPIQPWLNSIITNQIRNLIRNYYSNHARPCLKCGAATDLEGCSIYKKQCSDCPLYAKWQQRKQPANNIKMPVSIENHSHEVKQIFDETSDVFRHVEALHAKMKEVLRPLEYQVYEGLFIHHSDEATVARKLGYISNERGRPPGYKQIKNIRKIIIAKVRKVLADGEVDIF